ncbi:MAG: NAD(+)/NADH kinase [Eubacteriales bacterium]
MTKKVGLWVNKTKIDADVITPQLINWFNAQGWDTISDWDSNKSDEVEFVLSLGGDGTVLEAARNAAIYSIPVLGVNFGKLGFLCEIEKGEIYSALKSVVLNDYSVEERLMLKASLKSTDNSNEYLVLNDVVFLRDAKDALVTLQVKLSGERIASPPSDGLIIATPTGSTAYSLSAGGPVVSPDVQAILITPISAHALSSRPMIVSNRENIDIILTRGHECNVTFDGKDTITMNPGDTMRISDAPIRAKLIRLGNRSFPKIVREKLRDRWHE